MSFAVPVLAFALAACLPLCQAQSLPGTAGSASAVEVVLQAESIPVLHDKLMAWLTASFSRDGAAVQVRPAGAWALQGGLLPSVKATIASTTEYNGVWHVSVLVSSAEAGRDPVRATLRYRVSELRPVWVATLPFRKGDELSCQSLRQELRPVTVASGRGSSRYWAGACEQAHAWRLRRALESGDVLQQSDLAKADAVLAQQEAVVVTRVGGIEIRAKGLILNAGNVGQTVPVRLHGQPDVIQAMVTAPGTLQVMEGESR